jgi:hypothetical protein
MLAISKSPTNKKEARSRVTNGLSMFIDRGTDQRSTVARRLRDLTKLHTLDVSPNGPEHLSAAQAQMIRRISMLEVQAELMEARMVDGDDKVDVESYARISSHLRRLYECLGLRKAKRDTVPNLNELIAKHRMAAKKVAQSDNDAAVSLVADASSEPATDLAQSAVHDAAPIDGVVA